MKNINEETYEKILCEVANCKEVTQYEITKKVGLTYAPVHEAIERLLLAALIEEVRTKKGQGPLPKRYFRLTFAGFLTVLNFFFSASPEKNITQGESPKTDSFSMKNVRAVILTQRDFYPQIKFFSEWEFLEGIFDFRDEAIPGLYDALRNALAVCNDKFRPLEKANLISEKLKDNSPSFLDYHSSGPWFESWFAVRFVNEWANFSLKERLAFLKENFLPEYSESLTRKMQSLFLRAFFNGLLTVTKEIKDIRIEIFTTENKVFFEFASSYFEKEKKRKRARIKKFDEDSALFLKLFDNGDRVVDNSQS